MPDLAQILAPGFKIGFGAEPGRQFYVTNNIAYTTNLPVMQQQQPVVVVSPPAARKKRLWSEIAPSRISICFSRLARFDSCSSSVACTTREAESISAFINKFSPFRRVLAVGHTLHVLMQHVRCSFRSTVQSWHYSYSYSCSCSCSYCLLNHSPPPTPSTSSTTSTTSLSQQHGFRR